MVNVVLLGGNGYIGQNIINTWMKQDSNVNFYVYSRSNKNRSNNPNIKSYAVDVTDFSNLKAFLPNKIDYIIDLVGHPEKEKNQLKRINEEPARTMLELANTYHVKGMGFIQGSLGPKAFLEVKQRTADMLVNSGIPTAIVNPTLVYGNGRSDALSKLVPLFKFLGAFAAKLRPVHVSVVAEEMVIKLRDIK
ncbi:NAD-dependent epimerase/dehydratase family protein [Fructobacillus sp. CRL 2054]|uniref:NAD-dependent epimerase/dehydratase family protein n=1 Tax=Fructobacillus sp. CRL 2054 TaxID=2763007 RepID=UPI0023783B91|nr:NAD-dependent epimerase/dehydratase family protein [Fructobacillus sp. CRL 2054]MDD9138855.1 NAD-dependent epimerase/dehydratase family protein [Fructobacillus sp. CRL 2054]